MAARPVRLIVAVVPAQIAELAAVDVKIYVVQVTGAGLNANKIAPFLMSLFVSKSAFPFPVTPAAAFIAQAQPTAEFWPLLVPVSYNSVNAPGEVVFQLSSLILLPTCPNITIAAFALIVVTLKALILLLYLWLIVVKGVLSKGVDVSTPEKAMIAPDELSVPPSKAKV